MTLLILAPSLAWAESTAPFAGGPAQESARPRLTVGPFTAAPVAIPPALPGPSYFDFGDGERKSTKPFEFGFETSGGRTSVGVGGGLAEGKPLEVAIWGGGGAIAGSLAGPLGAIVGAGAGALCGLLYSVFVVPHNGPEKNLQARVQ